MRKLHIITAAALLLMGSTATASAQGFLKGLADKAKQKVKEKIEQKVEKTVDDTMDGVLDGKGKSTKSKTTKAESTKSHANTTRSSYDADEDIFQRYVAELAAPEDPNDVSSPYTNNAVEADAMTFRSMADAIKAFPPLPTVEQMLSLDTAPVKALIGFAGGVNSLLEEIIMQTNAANMQAKAKHGGGSGAQMGGGAAQILAYMQQHGIDPDKMSDEQMAAMQQAIASGELKIDAAGSGAFAIDPGYSEEMEAAVGRVSDKVDAIMEKVNTTFQTEQGFSTDAFGLNAKLKPLYAEIQAAWLTSDACQRVKAIEQDIDARADEYFKQQPDYGASGTLQPYPDFWVQGRKQQNELIRGFNAAQAEKWRGVLLNAYEKYLPEVKAIVPVESELEGTFTDKMDLIYTMQKQHLATALMHWSTMYQLLLSHCYDMPLVSEVAEQNDYEL